MNPKLENILIDAKMSCSLQLLVLGNFVGVEELEGAARTLDEEFAQLTETEVGNPIMPLVTLKRLSWQNFLKTVQVAVAYSALRHLHPGVAKGLGVRIHQTFGFRL